MLTISDSGANIHLERQATPKMAPVIMYNEMKAILSDGITMDYTHIATLHLTCLTSLERQIHILLKRKTSPLILLGVSCGTITLDNQAMSIQNNGE